MLDIMMKQGVKDSVVKVMADNPTHLAIQSLGGIIIRDCTTVDESLFYCSELLVQQAAPKSAVDVASLLSNLGMISSIAQAGDSAKNL